MAVLIMGLSDIGFCVFFRKYMCGVDVLDKGCGGIFNVLSGGFLCRVLCISVLSLSWLCMISLGLVFFGFSTKSVS